MLCFATYSLVSFPYEVDNMGIGYSAELGKDSLLEETKMRLDRSLQQLRANDPDVEFLDLSNHGVGAKGVDVGSAALANNTVLKLLDLSYNNITAVGATPLAEALAQNTALLRLNLAGNNLGDDGAAAMAEYLRADPPLEELVLYHNDISDKGFCEIINALQTNTHLIFLNLSMNRLTNKSLVMLGALLEGKNQTLSHVSLKGNQIKVDLNPKKYAALEDQIQRALAANEERVSKHKHIEEIKAQKAKRRAEREEEQKKLEAEKEAAERQRIEEEIRQRQEQEVREAAEVQKLEHEMQQKKRRLEERQAKNDPSARAAKAQAWTERAIEQAYAWRNKLTLDGQFVKEWRNGFTVMTTAPGDKPGAAPHLTAEIPRRLKACWCDPQDATAPFAGTLHYHCKYEEEADNLATKSEDVDAPPKYMGCRGTGHTCASIGFYAKPLPNLSAANFFASQAPTAPVE